MDHLEFNPLKGTQLSIDTIVAELKAERERINDAINALNEISSNGTSSKHSTTTAPQKSGGMTAAGRKRISEMMKARWAARRKKAKSKT
jgi:hypothetical protein